MIDITYTLTERICESDDGVSKSYGIAVCTNTDRDQTTSVLTSIQDITTDRDALDELVNLCNSMELSPLHIRDVIEDFLVR